MEANYHDGCGGTILYGGSGETAHYYCDRCGAYTHDLDLGFPTGADEARNREAWDDGEVDSPNAEAVR